jgi:hypothetical protein
MEINNSYGTYTTSYTNTAKKADSTKESNVTTSTVEMKTSTSGVTRTEQIKTGYSNVNDYSQYLQSKYSYMNTGTTSMQGVPTTVSVSSAFLQKCMNDPEKAKYLEENLAAIPDCVKSLNNYVKMAPGSPVVTYATYKIDENGNISIMSGSTNDPDGKIAKENAERKAKEKKAAEEKAAKSRAEKKAEQEKLAEKRAEKKANEEARAETPDYTVSATGTDIKTVTQSVVSASLGTSTSTGASFDIKA